MGRERQALDRVHLRIRRRIPFSALLHEQSISVSRVGWRGQRYLLTYESLSPKNIFGVSRFCGSTFLRFCLSRSWRNFILCCCFAKLVQNERDLAQDAGYIARPLYILCRREWLRESWLAICWNRREHVGTAPRAPCCRRKASSSERGTACSTTIPSCIRLRR